MELMDTNPNGTARAPVNPCLKSSYDTDVVRLIGQHLVNLGLKQTVDLLLKETGLQGLDHPIATNFKQHILAGEWDRANSLVIDITNLINTLPPTTSSSSLTSVSNHQQHPTGDSLQQQQQQQPSSLKTRETVNQIRLLIAEQKFLELIEDGQHLKALKCLRVEIAPITNGIKHIQHLATLLMCKSTDEVKARASWTGKGIQSRQLLVEKIQRFIPPLIMLPPKRLNTLLKQAIQLQQERCSLHLNSHYRTTSSIHQATTQAITSSSSSSSSSASSPSPSTSSTATSQQQPNGTNNVHSATTDTIDNNSSSFVANDIPDIDLKVDHICSADRFPLNSRQELDNHKSEVWFCRWSNDGTRLATGGLGGKVKIWTLDPNEQKLSEKCTFECSSYSITCLSWSPNDTYLLVCGSEDKPDLFVYNVNREETHNVINNSEDESTTTCSWHLSGEKFAAASIKGNFNIYDLDGNRRGSREGVRVQCLSFLYKDPNYILAADTLNRIKAYAIKDMSLESDEEDVLEERHSIMSFTVDRDDRYIAVNLMEQGVHLWDYRLKTLLRMFPGVCQRNMTIYSSFSSPDSTFLASGSEDGKVYIYNIRKEQPVAILHGHSRCVNCVSWNPRYPELLVSVSDDRVVRLWAPIRCKSHQQSHLT